MARDVWADGDAWTVAQLIQARLESDPDSELFDVNGEQWTGRTLFSAADRFANAMRAYGLEKGDRVATLVENSSEAVISQFGAVQLGGVGVPINTAYKGEYLRHQLADSGAKVLVIDGDVADRARAIADSIDTLEHVVVLGGDAGGAVGETTPGTNWHSWAEVMSADDAPTTVAVSPTDLYVFIYTGGTTGLSKACVINNNYCVTLTKQIANMWERGPDDVVWTPLPLFHFNAVTVVLVGTLLIGGRAAIYKKFSVSNFWPEINRTGATHASTLGSMVTLIANDPVRPEAARLGHARGEQDAALHVGRADAAGRRTRNASSGSGSSPSTAVTAPPRHRSGVGCRPGWRTSRTRPASSTASTGTSASSTTTTTRCRSTRPVRSWVARARRT